MNITSKDIAGLSRRRKSRPEGELVKACLNFLHLRGVMAWRNNTTGVYDPTRKKFRTFTGMKGVSDILGVLPGGRFFAVECKNKGNKPSPDQYQFLASVREFGGVAVVAYSVDDVEKAINHTHTQG